MNKEIGMLRQWLNEDRITDPKKMVTNEELLIWLTPKNYKAPLIAKIKELDIDMDVLDILDKVIELINKS
jgi:hypothetical protein